MKITGDDIAFGSATVALAILALAAFLTSIPIWVPSDLFLRMALGALWWVAGAALLFAGVFGGLYAHARFDERRHRERQLELLIRAARGGHGPAARAGVEWPDPPTRIQPLPDWQRKREPTGPLVVKRPPGLKDDDDPQADGYAVGRGDDR